MKIKSDQPWILGISASHNGGCCLLKGERIVVAIQEERLSRKKRHRIFAGQRMLSIDYCLQYAGIRAADLDLVVSCVQGFYQTPQQDVHLNAQLQTGLHQTPVLNITHHRAHAISAFATSGFKASDILVVDGNGTPFQDLSEEEQKVAVGIDHVPGPKWETISLYHAVDTTLTPLEKHFTHTYRDQRAYGETEMPLFSFLGGMFEAAGKQVFNSRNDAGKVMGLAAYGVVDTPVEDFFEIVDGRFVFSDVVPNRFRFSERWPQHETRYQNLCASIQNALEVALDHVVARFQNYTDHENLCYAGGVALNSVYNERLIRQSGKKRVHIVSAAEDSGPAIGAAYAGLWHLGGTNTYQALHIDSMGRSYTPQEIDQALAAVPNLKLLDHAPDQVIAETAARLARGEICGWFQGGSELGPRALGHRSILCDARHPDAKATLNHRVKRREGFRPFAPAVLKEEAANWFDFGDTPVESPFMLRVVPFLPHRKEQVPAVVHADGTGRVQTVTPENGPYYQLVKAFFELTGVPLILNTSFNVMGEPIVETPDDALWCFIDTDMDFCVLHDRMVEKADGQRTLMDLYPRLRQATFETGRRPLIAGSDQEQVTFTVEGRWGRLTYRVGFAEIPLLEAMTGAQNGWSLLERFKETGTSETQLLNAMRQWRRFGLIDLSADPKQ